MGKRLQHARHLIRMALLFAAGIAAFLVARQALMPAGFGEFGHYRAGAIHDNTLRAASYAGQAACAACHDEVVATRAAGRHARLSCEGCHGPLAAHAGDPTAATAPRPDPRLICLRCHARDRARPQWLPQVVVADHSAEGPCTECHTPHQPGLE